SPGARRVLLRGLPGAGDGNTRAASDTSGGYGAWRCGNRAARGGAGAAGPCGQAGSEPGGGVYSGAGSGAGSDLQRGVQQGVDPHHDLRRNYSGTEQRLWAGIDADLRSGGDHLSVLYGHRRDARGQSASHGRATERSVRNVDQEPSDRSDYLDRTGSAVSSEQFWSIRFLPGAPDFLAGGADRSRVSDVAEPGQRSELTGGADEHTGKMPVPKLHDPRADGSRDRNHDRGAVPVARNPGRPP